MSPTIRTVTLGCKVNQYETELVREGFARAGFSDAVEHESADVCVVNTCTVTAEGDAKSRQTIRRLARENPRAQIVVMGCYATRAPEEIAAIPGVAEVVTDKRELPDLLDRFGIHEMPTGISRFANHHRAFVKVQDGCLLRCSYCIIPHVRPRMASRPWQPIVEEVGRLVENGYREIVLTGIHLGHYGVDFNQGKPKSEWKRLSHLVDRLARLPGEFRIRLSSIEATEVTRELLEVMRSHADRVCPHLHVCMQSGSDAVLRRMRRRWSNRHFLDRCRLIRDYLPDPALTTDVIVGFPGETDDDFQRTCDAVREAAFSKVHAFSFSARRGTPAASMPGQVPPQVRAARLGQLEQLAASLRDTFHRQQIGSRMEVLVETPPGSELPLPAGLRDAPDRFHAFGTSCRYAPVLLTQPARNGRLYRAIARQFAEGCLIAELA
ncbi:MAG: tRNA (N(6)-L-threonylcarbamoyladenosine(37)-C(2))-methylthiotransferase MtaB [Planctomycetes bacterium]|nr:tRNA (N(6)-L-threonylcarbamoyladenosine(37)-C(2))-methylthiotransferase MtaB [Planctomycetota bacterium]